MTMFRINLGDTRPALRYRMPKEVDAAGASIVMSVGDILVRRPVETVSQDPLVVQYDWRPSDALEPGLYPLEFEVLYPDGGVETISDEGTLGVLVVK